MYRRIRSRKLSNEIFCSSNPCGERLVSRGALNGLAYSFQLDTEINSPLLGRGQGSSRKLVLELSLDGVNDNEKCKIENGKRKDFTVLLNLFQHLTSLACNLFADKILKRVQDDNLTMEGLLCFP